jgi:hypothetical protein
MAYTLSIADALVTTLQKFVTLNTYQLAGHITNLDFWQSQVINSLVVLDGYDSRERVREKVQREYIGRNDTRRFAPDELTLYREFGDSEFLAQAVPDRHRLDASTLQAKRRDVTNTFYRFLQRCHKEELLLGERAKEVLAHCGIGIEPGDFQD